MNATGKERRKDEKRPSREMRAELNESQRMTLTELERFGWQLKFIRRPIFQASIPVMYDLDRKIYAVLEADGTLNEHPPFDIRDD